MSGIRPEADTAVHDFMGFDPSRPKAWPALRPDRLIHRNQSGTADISHGTGKALRSRALCVEGRDDNRDRRAACRPGAPRVGLPLASQPSGDVFMAMGRDSIMVGKSYRTPGDEVRTVQSIDNDEVVYRAACGASPT